MTKHNPAILLISMGGMGLGLLPAPAAFAQAAPDQAQAAQTDAAQPGATQSGSTLTTVTVTGSRVITNINNSPTPIVSMSIAQLQATTPSDIPDALNKLPQFVASRSQATTGGSTINWPGNFLNLLDLGTNRTLILLDGMRVPATDSSNDVDINTIPQELVERVDTVTGGASAVYGSDADAGVVNFVLNHHFNGVRLIAQGGISTYGDDGSRKFGIIAGRNLFGDRGHIEFSAQQYVSNGIKSDLDRPYGALVPMELGLGTAASPYHLVLNARNTSYTPGGYIGSGPLANMTFATNGVLSPFVNGAPGQGFNQIGGGGGYFGESYSLFPGVNANPTLAASLTTNRAFGRFDYDLTTSTHAFVMANISQARNYGVSQPQNFTATYAADNAFLPASAQALLAAGGATTFTMSKALMDDPGAISDGYTSNVNLMTGIDGDLFGYTWQAHYTHGQSVLHETSPDTLNYQRLYAAMDAVINPANGQVVCRATLTAGGAAAYPGCIPFNAFGPSADDPTAFNWATDDMQYKTTNIMDDVGANISGTPINDWAGPVRTALDAEYRNLSLQTESNFQPTATVNCQYQNPLTCNPNHAIWNGAVANMPRVSESVREGALELGIPILKDLPLVRSLDINAAGRYTDYSTVGGAVSWKFGGVWNIADQFRLRGAVSRDIGAPTLSNLFAPVNGNITAFTDSLTGASGNTELKIISNPHLKPEVSKTITVGFVFTPPQVSGLTASVDYYHLVIDNEISNVNGGNPTVEALCAAGGTQYCLTQRPFPITDTSPDNYPTAILIEGLNNGRLSTTMYDADIDYNFPLERFVNGAGGIVTSRLLFTYQPKLVTVAAVPGSPQVDQAGAEATNGVGSVAAERATLVVGYETDRLSANVQERYQSREAPNPQSSYVYANTSYVAAIFYTDFSMSYQVTKSGSDDGGGLRANLAIANAFNKQPTLFIGPGRTGAEGYAYAAPFDEDVVGRYFTIGLELRF